MDRDALRAVFSVDYHMATLRARAGHDGYREWGLRLIETPPALAPLRLDTAAARLAQLDANDLHRRHAAGSMAMAIATAARSGQNWGLPTVQNWSELAVAERFIEADVLEDVRLGRSTPMQAYMSAAFSGSGCSITLPDPTFSYDFFEVTTVSIAFTVGRSIDNYFRRFDPRMWDVNAPQSFEEADRIDEADRIRPVPGDPNIPPPPTIPADETQDSGDAGEVSWSGALYENAVTAVSDFKNILSIDYQISSDRISLQYWLSEALVMDIGGSGPIAGGLDRDSGVARLERIDAGSTRVFASKSVRIAHPPDKRDMLNQNMSIALLFWFNSLVLFGVCENLEG